MTKLFCRLRFLFCIFGLSFPLARAQSLILDKARAFIGSEIALSAVNSLRFIGELEVVEVGQTSGSVAQIEIILQKPYRQRITATSKNRSETTALDGYDAWQKVFGDQGAAEWEVNLLGPDQIKRLRANTFENLSFYRGLDQAGGHIEDRGELVVEGVPCHKLAFVHGPGISFMRSFELSTGRLVLTETESGTQIREEGEIHAGGLRFPQRMVTLNSMPNGDKRIIKVTFSSIEVNPALDVGTFEIPSLSN